MHTTALHPIINTQNAFDRIKIIDSSPHFKHLCILTSDKKKNTRTNNTQTNSQLQNVLSEFDFLHDLDHPQPLQQAYHPARPTHIQAPSTPPIPQQRPQITFSGDVYHRPVMSMPPVILMGAPVCDGGTNINYIPSSPIVEMPPSPAPTSMMYVEFPGDEIDDVNMIQNIVEVRIESNFFFFFFLFYFFCLVFNFLYFSAIAF